MLFSTRCQIMSRTIWSSCWTPYWSRSVALVWPSSRSSSLSLVNFVRSCSLRWLMPSCNWPGTYYAYWCYLYLTTQLPSTCQLTGTSLPLAYHMRTAVLPLTDASVPLAVVMKITNVMGLCFTLWFGHIGEPLVVSQILNYHRFIWHQLVSTYYSGILMVSLW